jgi:hypothetical protein
VRKTYSKAIAATSDKMRALIEGGMLESDTRSAELEGVMTEDFDRYYEFAMRGDYTIPSWTIDEPSPSSRHGNNKPEPANRNNPPSLSVQTAPPKPKHRFDSQKYLVDGDKNSVFRGFTPRSNTSSNQNFKSIFLAHARLYNFADMQLAHPLKQLTLHKLHQTLMGFQLFRSRVGDIIELARYAYDHNMDRREDGAVDKLRMLVVLYITREIEIIGKTKEWEALIEEGGEFVVDFWRACRVEWISS